jgi:TPR repeat protein
MMKKLIYLSLLLFSCSAFADLPIVQTSFRKAPLQVVQTRAGAGDAEAQVELALRYYAGYQVEKNDVKALQLMFLAADEKHPDALYLMSRMAAEGIGMKPDPEKEEAWFAKAIAASPKNRELQELYEQYAKDAVRGPRVLNACAEAGYRPAILQQQSATAVELYKEGQYDDALLQALNLAESGSVEGAWYAGRIYADGKSGIAVDEVEALSWFRQAAEGGLVEAQYEVAMRIANGLGIEADPEQAEIWYRKAAGNGHAGAQFQLAEIEFRRAEAAENISLLDRSAKLQAGTYKQALKEAVRWYEAAAAQEHPAALFVMGRLLASGEGMNKNMVKAVEFYERAKAQGNAEAGFYQGLMAHAGLGGERDLSRAVELYQEAAGKGVPGALYYLANCYRFGSGLSPQPIRGESIYYGKLLKGIEQNNADSLPDEWTLAAAREYGLILWNRATTVERRFDASSWVGLAAQNGDEQAQEIFRKMNEKNLTGLSTGGAVTETKVNPAADAVRKRRSTVFFPYVQQDLKALYPSSDVENSIISVDKGFGSRKNILGSVSDGLSIKYSRPEAERSVGLQGIFLVGIEFSNNDTDEHYWSFAAYQDDLVKYSEVSECNLIVAIDTAECPGAKLSQWAVAYGHLLADGRTVAVIDTESSGKESFTELFARNRYSKGLANSVSASVDAEQLIYTVLGLEVEDEGSFLDYIIDLIDLTD